MTLSAPLTQSKLIWSLAPLIEFCLPFLICFVKLSRKPTILLIFYISEALPIFCFALKSFKMCLFFAFIYVCLCSLSSDDYRGQKGALILWLGVTCSCEPPDVAAGNQTWVFAKRTNALRTDLPSSHFTVFASVRVACGWVVYLFWMLFSFTLNFSTSPRRRVEVRFF